MKTKKIIAVFVIMVIVFALSCYVYIFHKPHKSSRNKECRYTIEAVAINKEFVENESVAQQKYVGTQGNEIPVCIQGTILSMTERLIVIGEEGGAVKCELMNVEEEIMKMKKYRSGDLIKIKGFCVGLNLFDVEFNYCCIVEDIAYSGNH